MLSPGHLLERQNIAFSIRRYMAAVIYDYTVFFFLLSRARVRVFPTFSRVRFARFNNRAVPLLIKQLFERDVDVCQAKNKNNE